VDCDTLCCPHTIKFLAAATDLRAAIAALPRTAPEPMGPPYRLLALARFWSRTSEIAWRGTTWTGRVPVVVTEFGCGPRRWLWTYSEN
jgi:hypothetical protein